MGTPHRIQSYTTTSGELILVIPGTSVEHLEAAISLLADRNRKEHEKRVRTQLATDTTRGISYDEVFAGFMRLHPTLSHDEVRRSVGAIWGAVHRAAERSRIPFDFYCPICERHVLFDLDGPFGEWPACRHFTKKRGVLQISIKSLFDNEQRFMKLDGNQLNIGPAIKRKYRDVLTVARQLISASEV